MNNLHDTGNFPHLVPVARACLEHSMSREERDRIIGITRDPNNQAKDVVATHLIVAAADRLKQAGGNADQLWN